MKKGTHTGVRMRIPVHRHLGSGSNVETIGRLVKVVVGKEQVVEVGGKPRKTRAWSVKQAAARQKNGPGDVVMGNVWGGGGPLGCKVSK